MTSESIDINALRRLLKVIGGDLEDFEELLTDFLDSTPHLLSRLRDAAERQSLDEVRIDAHTLKGTAREFGALNLSELCRQLEAKCREGSPFGATGLVEEIADEESLIRVALKNIEVSGLAGS